LLAEPEQIRRSARGGFREISKKFEISPYLGRLARETAPRYAVYVFDYGAPTGFRLAVKHPDRITAIISQDGNADEEGPSDLTPFEGCAPGAGQFQAAELTGARACCSSNYA
jgi:pimeloyl-ACP methyl ester carboxylesterase